MELTIKQLKQHGQIFVPQTTAEAVLVKDGEEVITLDNMLERKIEQIITPAGSGLQAFKQGSNIILAHSNSITANESPSSVKVKYDSRGHIVEVAPTSEMTVVVDQEGYFSIMVQKTGIYFWGMILEQMKIINYIKMELFIIWHY